jgi:hypothetical protein
MMAMPPFPAAPRGVPRLSHRPTVLAALHYWRAGHATSRRGSPEGRTAGALAAIYESALVALDAAPGESARVREVA